MNLQVHNIYIEMVDNSQDEYTQPQKCWDSVQYCFCLHSSVLEFSSFVNKFLHLIERVISLNLNERKWIEAKVSNLGRSNKERR